MHASKVKKSNQNRGKSVETGALSHISDAAHVYYGGGVRITRAMKMDIETKSSRKNVSGKGESQLGSKKIRVLVIGLSARTSSRKKSAATKQDEQHKKQKSTTSVAEQTKGVEYKQNKVQKELKRSRSRSTTNEESDKTPKHDKVVKKHKPSPPSYVPSARQMRVMRSLGLAAPIGSPFHKK